MGFGTLIFGSLLLFNVVYYQLTDVICASILLYGLYKLSGVERSFRFSYFACYGFLALSLAELTVGAMELISPLADLQTLTVYLTAVRAIAVSLTLIPLLLGMRRLGLELKVRDLPERCRTAILLVGIAYGVTLIASIPPLLSLFGQRTQLILYMISICGQMISSLWVLTSLYKSYATICMPKGPTANGNAKG